jgi:Chromo (CHRromatin Organisation MOdifier) domain
LGGVDRLLGKWTRAQITWYFASWSGFDDEHNTWEKQRDVGAGFIEEFEANHQGNDFAVERLLESGPGAARFNIL